jgi:hypothetical protein
MRLLSKSLLTATAVAGLVALSVAPADAALEMTLAETGFAAQTYTSATSPLVASGSYGTFSLNVNSGIADAVPSLDLGSQDYTTGTAGGTLVVTFSANGITDPTAVNLWLSQLTGNVVRGTATATLSTYLGTSLLDETTLLGTVSSIGGAVITSAAAPSSPYSLTEVLTITEGANAGVSLDASVARVAEPATLGLLGTALCGIGLVARRQRNKA